MKKTQKTQKIENGGEAKKQRERQKREIARRFKHTAPKGKKRKLQLLT